MNFGIISRIETHFLWVSIVIYFLMFLMFSKEG